MIEVIKAIGFMLLGVFASEYYNRRIWKSYREGREDTGKVNSYTRTR